MTYFSYMWLNLYGKLVGIFVPIKPRKQRKQANQLEASVRAPGG